MKHAALLALAACSSNGAVTVHVADPRDGGFVVFADEAGVRRVPLDAHGDAGGVIVDEGSVTAVTRNGEATAAVMYTHVKPGDEVEFGIAPPPPLDGEMTVDATMRPGTDTLVYSSACGSGVVDAAHVARLASACDATDLVVIACKRSSGVGVVLRSPVACDYVGGWATKPLQIGGSAVIADGDWRDLVAVPIGFSSAAGGELGPLDVSSAWSVLARTGGATVEDGTEAFLPGVGPTIVKGTAFQVEGGRAQDFAVPLASGVRAIDLRDVLSPWVTNGASTWTSDDEQHALVAHALVTRFTDGANTLDVYEAPHAGGSFTAPALPAPIAALISDEALHHGVVRLVRTEGADFTPGTQRLANIVVSGGDPGGTGYAITELPP